MSTDAALATACGEFEDHDLAALFHQEFNLWYRREQNREKVAKKRKAGESAAAWSFYNAEQQDKLGSATLPAQTTCNSPSATDSLGSKSTSTSEEPTFPKKGFVPASLGAVESLAMREALFNPKDGLIFQEPVVTRKSLQGRPKEFLRTLRGIRLKEKAILAVVRGFPELGDRDLCHSFRNEFMKWSERERQREFRVAIKQPALPVTSGVHDEDAGHKEDCPEISEPAPLQAIVAGDQQIEKTVSLERPDPLIVTQESQQLATSAARLPYKLFTDRNFELMALVSTTETETFCVGMCEVLKVSSTIEEDAKRGNVAFVKMKDINFENVEANLQGESKLHAWGHSVEKVRLYMSLSGKVEFEWPLAYIKMQGRSLLTLIKLEALKGGSTTT